MFKLPFNSKLAHAQRQRGVTLIEALVALLVMSFGMIALVGLMSNLRRGAELAKQRSEAMRIAKKEMATLRAFSVVGDKPAGAPADTVSYDKDIIDQTKPTAIQPPDSNTTYSLQDFVEEVDGTKGMQAKRVRVSVSWYDRVGEQQTVHLDTVIARVDPFYSAVVGFTPQAAPVARPSGRNAVIPDAAQKLDKNNSAFRPSSTSDRVWVFNNSTGVITKVCDISVGTTLTTAVIAGCTSSTTSYLLSGTVRFSNTDPANPSAPEAAALPIGVTFVGGDFSVPRLDGSGNVKSGTTAIAVSATAPTAGNTQADNTYDCFYDYAGNGQLFVNYYCLVTPAASTPPAPRTWSGQLQLTGLSTGQTATQYKVCRYSADYNGNGSNLLSDGATIDNLEHPLVYYNVTGSIARQNFLVVRGNVSCPSAHDVSPSAGIFADYKTVQIQP